MNRLSDTVIGATATQVGDGLVDALIGGAGVGQKKTNRCNEDTRLAIAALSHLPLQPGRLKAACCLGDGMILRFSDTFDGHDGAVHGPRFDLAGPNGTTIDEDGTGTTETAVAAILGSGQTQLFPQSPKERRIRIDGQPPAAAIHDEFEQRVPPVGLVQFGV